MSRFVDEHHRLVAQVVGLERPGTHEEHGHRHVGCVLELLEFLPEAVEEDGEVRGGGDVWGVGGHLSLSFCL